MNKKVITGLFLLIIAAAAVALLWPSDERRIRKLFKEGVAAAESRDLDGIMAKVSYNYQDDYGMNYMYLKEILKREFEKLSDIKVEHRNLSVRILKDEGRSRDPAVPAPARAVAEIDIRVLATMGTETGYIIGDPKEPQHLIFTLEKERLHWSIVKTEGLRQ